MRFLGIVGVGAESVVKMFPAVVSTYSARRIASKRSTFSPVTGVQGTRYSVFFPSSHDSCPGYWFHISDIGL